ncbi:primosomal protein N' family DNA-binding protein [Parafrigoribacterium soli]|uniref:primosomal protein N' family DNA-binding protein n=1 Tax=Parafrigoribacterium soli TaxID=3144663 RepID=UPI0032EAB8A7
MAAASIARVLIDSSLPQLDRLFDYRVPAQFASDAKPGVRVRVPLRSADRIADGIIIELVSTVEYSGTLNELDAVVSPVPILAPEVWALARRVADRAAGTANDVVRLAVPKRQVRVEKAWLAEPSEERPPAVLRPVQPTKAPGYAPEAFEQAIASRKRLAVEVTPLVAELPGGAWVGEWAIAMAAAASESIALDQTAILCVPDYRDQEQLLAALAAVLPPERIVRLDARQSNPDRYRATLACLDDRALVVVGNRSVVYAPAGRLGLIALWDDGDPLHAEPLSPYVHSRDAALVRQEQQGCALFFFAHSRSAEVQRLVELRWLDTLRPLRGYAPKVIPTSQQAAQDPLAARARIPTTAWKEARAALEHGPVLVQVARPGYAPRLACQDCGQAARCLRCQGPLGLKTARSAPACTWCGALAAEWHCENCEGRRLRLVGQGATRTAEDLGRAFPGVRVIIADGDRPLLTVGPAPALVIATRGAEPVAAGGYRAVLLLDGERMVARESLRVAEDCLRWWSNATALAARGATTVLVGVGGALASALATWQLPEYVRQELADRRALRFPPAVRVVTITGSATAVETALASIPQAEHPEDEASIDVLGPVAIPSGGVRAIARFDYAAGARVAAALRAEVIRNATSRRKRAAGAAGQPPMPTLKVRFDDTEPFAD